MKIRIKYIKKNLYEGYYVVQVKKWLLFWKTIYTTTSLHNAEIFIDTLAQIDEFNNKTKSLNKIVYEGWAVRNVYQTTGPAFSISFFNSSVHKHKPNDYAPGTIWVDCNNSIVPTMEIKAQKLFGKECLEPMKLRITIEQIKE